jgi:predicted GTPase
MDEMRIGSADMVIFVKVDPAWRDEKIDEAAWIDCESRGELQPTR